MVSQKPGRPNDSKSDQWQQDLNPNLMAGQNDGIETTPEGRYDLTAYEIDKLRDRLEDFNDDELKQIPVLKPGTRLQQGATYINLNDPQRQEYTGVADMSVDETDLIVPKSEVGYQLWNRLIGIENPQRTGQ
jgi:hypothetical protein